MVTHLVTFDLDQLLQSVHIKVTVLVVVSQVARVKPALTVDLSGFCWSVEVGLHDLRQRDGRLHKQQCWNWTGTRGTEFRLYATL